MAGFLRSGQADHTAGRLDPQVEVAGVVCLSVTHPRELAEVEVGHLGLWVSRRHGRGGFACRGERLRVVLARPGVVEAVQEHLGEVVEAAGTPLRIKGGEGDAAPGRGDRLLHIGQVARVPEPLPENKAQVGQLLVQVGVVLLLALPHRLGARLHGAVEPRPVAGEPGPAAQRPAELGEDRGPEGRFARYDLCKRRPHPQRGPQGFGILALLPAAVALGAGLDHLTYRHGSVRRARHEHLPPLVDECAIGRNLLMMACC